MTTPDNLHQTVEPQLDPTVFGQLLARAQVDGADRGANPEFHADRTQLLMFRQNGRVEALAYHVLRRHRPEASGIPKADIIRVANKLRDQEDKRDLSSLTIMRLLRSPVHISDRNLDDVPHEFEDD